MELSGNFALLLAAIGLVVCALYCMRKRATLLYALSRLLFIVYLGIVVAITLFPLIIYAKPGQSLPQGAINLIPFVDLVKTISMYGGYHDWRATIPWTVIGGNIALFIPLGVFLPLIFPKLRQFKYFILTAVLSSCAIELTQLLSGLVVGQVYRYVDINDVILNSVGALLGFGLYVAVARLVRRKKIDSSPVSVSGVSRENAGECGVPKVKFLC